MITETKERPTEAFVENPSAAAAAAARSPRRISLKLDDSGNIDWQSVSEKTKQQFTAAVSNDPDALELIGGSAGEGGEVTPLEENTITEDHVKMFLDGYAATERWLIPRVIAKKSNNIVVIPPEISKEVFTFTEDQKNSLAPDGAEWANETMPDWLRKFIFETVGPGARFFGQLAYLSYTKTKIAVDMTMAAQQAQPQNGHAVGPEVTN